MQTGLSVAGPSSSPVRGGSPPRRASSATYITCCVCYDDFPADAPPVSMPCGHGTCCAKCWQRYIRARLDDGQACSIHCPEPGCQVMLPLGEARKLLPPETCAPLFTNCASAPICTSALNLVARSPEVGLARQRAVPVLT